MRSLQSVVCTLPGYIVYFAAMLLTAAQLAVLLRLFREKHGAARIILSLLHFLIGISFLTVLLDYSYNALIEGRPEQIHSFELKRFSVPWLVYAGLEIVSFAVILLYERVFRQRRNTRLTADSIRQTVDFLTTGLLISDSDGTVLLANLKMTELCRMLTGELLSDAGSFWKYIENSAFRDYLIQTPDGETWQFAKSRIELDGKTYDQITASDMTEQYRVTKELSEKNRHLKEVQQRMRSVAAKERSLVAAREIMNARMIVHDRMGAVLLSGKYYLDHPENVKEEELLRLLEYGSYFLLGEAQQQEGDLLQEALQNAQKIGVDTDISGDIPENHAVRGLLAQAIDQCAANTVRHAGGDRLFVKITEEQGGIFAEFSNNGKAPEGPVTETGGLAALRRATEAAGCTMTIQSDPAFLLTIFIPKQVII